MPTSETAVERGEMIVKYRIISIVLIFMMLLVLANGLSVSAEVSYEELLEQSKKDPNWGNSSMGDFRVFYPLRPGWGSLTVLLYTDIAKDLTFEVYTPEDEDADLEVFSPEETIFVYRNSTIMSPEITKATESCRAGTVGESRSALRECVKYFDISKEELLEAYRLMREEPEIIRSLFPFITDDEFNDSWNIPEYGFSVMTDIPQYALEALYMEDDAKAHRLLCREFAVYVEDLGIVISASDVLTEGKNFSFENLIRLDLTSDAMGEFIDYWRARYSPNSDDGKAFAELAAAREAQLKAAQTGDSAVTTLWVVAVAISFLAAVVAIRRKRI